MWTPTTRAQHMRAGLRYGSDLTDAEWAILEPLLPPPATCGRRRAWPMREIINAICYVLRSGCPWRLLPDSFPPCTTVYRWFARLRALRWWESVNHRSVAPLMPSCESPSMASWWESDTTQSWPALVSRIAMLPPIRPRPTIPNCISLPLDGWMRLG